jgi:hypothetical protein
LVFLSTIAGVSAISPKNELNISFSEKPPSDAFLYESYSMGIVWNNPSQRKSQTGCFLLIVKSDYPTIHSPDITFSYKGELLNPRVSGKSLEYRLPRQTFAPSASGSIMVEVRYNKQAVYHWEIGIADY